MNYDVNESGFLVHNLNNLVKKIMKIWELYNFNQVNRDKWVSEQAKKMPQGSVVLDVRAGGCRYKHLFNHREYNKIFVNTKVTTLNMVK